MLALPFSVQAQRSAPCPIGPCFEVGREDPNHGGHFASDADHFVYCPKDAQVEVQIMATALPIPCGHCTHPDRSVTWTVVGATSYSITNATEFLSSNSNQIDANATILLGDAGDTVTITCEVGDLEATGECELDRHDDPYEHSGNHSGASQSCTIKLWRLDLEANTDLDPVLGYSHYISQFASNVTISATAVGTSIYETDWTSIVDGNTLNEIENGSSSWSGKVVASTGIICWATVWNQCDLSYKKLAIEDVSIHPSIRRPGWITEVQYAGANLNWLSSDQAAFPQVDWSARVVGGIVVEAPTYGRNTNARSGYEMQFEAMVVPFYGDSTHYLTDYNSFSGKREEIASGPNMGLFYNTDNEMYEVNRQVLSNYWIKPSAGKPAIPVNYNGNPYTNWLQVFEAVKGANCKCLNPGMHGGTGAGTFYQANLYHEGYGNPNSPNDRLLGHLSRLGDGYATEPRAIVDPIYRCDLLYATTEEGLRAQNEGQRAYASAILSILQGTHHYIDQDPSRHSFYGDVHIYDPANGWKDMGKDTF